MNKTDRDKIEATNDSENIRNSKPLSLWPLSPEEALKQAASAPPISNKKLIQGRSSERKK